MAAKAIGSKSVAWESVRLFVASLPAILRRVFPLLLAAGILELVFERTYGLVALSVWCTWVVTVALGQARAIAEFLCASDDPELGLAISPLAFCIFVFAGAYIQLASLIASFFFVIPGALVYVSALLVPVLVLRQGLGPLDAIAESVERMRGNILPACGAFLLVWLPVLAVRDVGLPLADMAGLPKLAVFAAGVALSPLHLLPYALGVVLFRRLGDGRAWR